MREKVEAALRRSRADYTEIRMEEKETTTVVCRASELETAGAVIDAGGIVRCLSRDGGWGIATFNDRDDLETKVDRAYECARVVESEEAVELAAIPVVDETIGAALEDDFRGVALSEKRALVERYNKILLGHEERIVDTISHYQDTLSRVCFANSEGSFIEDERPLITVYLAAFARDGDNIQMAWESRSGQKGFGFVLGHEELAQAVAGRALDLLSAESVAAGVYPVVANNGLAGTFVHEAFGHLSESDFVYKDPQAREMMVLGRRFGPDTLTVFDDGSLPGLRGSHKYDDEGTPTRRTDLIKDGILVGRLHSRETAAKMGEEVTGNARATDYRYAPIVRMTNTAMEGGSIPFEELIRGIDLGIYACDAYGGQTALENFSFSSAYAYMIRDGEIAEMVKDVVLSGNLFTTLMNIDAIGDDFAWSQRGGWCGKGQGGLYVGMGAPHIRIQNVVVGGE